MQLAQPIKNSFSQVDRTRTMQDAWQKGRRAINRNKEIIAKLITPGISILHAGCGWDKNLVTKPYKDTCEVIGVDVDQRVAEKFHLASLSELPFPDQRFDMAVSEWVFEHLDDPAAAFRELSRVLKPGGKLVVLTPNFYSYKFLGAWATPFRFHLWMGKIRYGSGGRMADMYPTHYRCNTIKRFHQLAEAEGFRIVANEFINNGPTWFVKIPVLFELFHYYHLLLDRWEWAQQLRCSLLVVMEKE
jgi:ubiquinone/menaquinone biosynthesis C-methylase UbiE